MRGVGLRQRVARKVDGSLRMLAGFGHHVLGLLEVRSERAIRQGQRRFRRRVGGVACQRLFEKGHRLANPVFRTGIHRSAATEVKIEHRGIERMPLGELPLFPRRQRDLDLICNRQGHVRLKVQHVANIAIEALRPEILLAGAHSNQSRRDANAVARALHRALHHGVHAQFPGDSRQTLVSILILHGGGARNDAPSVNPHHGFNQLGRHSVGEVLFGIGGNRLQRQDRDGADGSRAGMGLPENAARDSSQRQHRPRRARATGQSSSGAASVFLSRPNGAGSASEPGASRRRSGSANRGLSPWPWRPPVPIPRKPGEPGVRTGGSCWCRMASNWAARVFPRKARTPVSISNSTAPKEKMSLRASSGSPRACSGDM
jgi:hypothetical protein